MGFVAGTSHLPTTTTAPHHAGRKRPRTQQRTMTLALCDPSTADQQQLSKATITRALMPFVPSREPIDAIPLSAAAPKKKKVASAADQQPEDAGALAPFVPSGEPIKTAPKKIAPAVVRAEPTWLRRGLLPHLRLRFDLPVYFIAEKTVTITDFVRQQNRFRLPSEGVIRNLRPMLSPLERKAANLLHQECPRPPKLPKRPKVPGEKRAKRQGKKHGGLPVLVVEPYAGIRELQLSRWDSSAGTVIKGEGYMDFIKKCGFKADDVVQIWAFKDTYFRLFGKDMCHDSPLYLLITKKE
jgi:hypothetical protein